VLVVPQLHRVYASATGANQMITLDEDTGQRLAQAPTGDYPDGLAYDPDHHMIWTTNESGGSETVINADTNKVRGTVDLRGGDGPDAPAYAPGADTLYVAAERGWLTLLDQHNRHLTVTGRAHLADGAHVVAVDPTTHRSYYPIPHGRDGRPALLTFDPNR